MSDEPAMEHRVAVLIPCYNEEQTITAVVRDFRAALPEASIYVYDNNSADETVAVAEAASAIVRTETLQGKGNVIRRMFADVEADVYLMVDGDSTYQASVAPAMIQMLIDQQLDMVVGTRLMQHDDAAFRSGHHIGNRLLTGCVGLLFGLRFRDILSGYRVFSRRFVKSFPALATGFETEIELTIHALELRMPTGEVETEYSARPEGSESKLRTYHDGFRLLMTILLLFKKERPFIFFLIIFLLLALLSFGLGFPLILEYWESGLVPRFPTAILASGIMMIAVLSLVCGIILNTVTHGRRELKRLIYLSIPATSSRLSQDSDPKRE